MVGGRFDLNQIKFVKSLVGGRFDLIQIKFVKSLVGGKFDLIQIKFCKPLTNVVMSVVNANKDIACIVEKSERIQRPVCLHIMRR